LAGRLRPRWVVRENVPAPTVQHFKAALEYIGYGAITIRVESSPLTGQLRQRDYIVGGYKVPQERVRDLFPDAENGRGTYTTRLGTREIVPALTTHRTRYDSRDCYIWEPQRPGLRILDAEEREALAGFPKGWTAGFSEATRARMCGNAAIPQVAEWIGKRLLDAHCSQVYKSST
jgi:site-specific DNA-cytosine methylase